MECICEVSHYFPRNPRGISMKLLISASVALVLMAIVASPKLS